MPLLMRQIESSEESSLFQLSSTSFMTAGIPVWMSNPKRETPDSKGLHRWIKYFISSGPASITLLFLPECRISIGYTLN